MRASQKGIVIKRDKGIKVITRGMEMLTGVKEMSELIGIDE